MGKNARIDELEKQVLLFKNKFVLLEANAKRGAADRVTKSGRSTERGKINLNLGFRCCRFPSGFREKKFDVQNFIFFLCNSLTL